MNFLALTEEDITKLREEGPPSGLQACPHWSFMRPFKWQGEWWVLFCCDDPNPRDEDFLGDFPRSKNCLPYRNNDREDSADMAENIPMIALWCVSGQRIEPIPNRTEMDNLSQAEDGYTREGFTPEFRAQLLELANEWVDSVEGD